MVKSKIKKEPLKLFSYGNSVSTQAGIAAASGLGIAVLSLLIQFINYGATSKLASKQAPSLIQLNNGEVIRTKAVEPFERSSETIKKFTSDTFISIFNWDGLVQEFDEKGNPITKPDTGIEIKNKEGKRIGRITTKAFEAAFALSENQDFRASFLRKMAQITPPGVFGNKTQVSLVPRYISNPRKIDRGKWEIDFIATLVTFKRSNNAGKGISFNKTITLESVSTPQTPPTDTPLLAQKIYMVRKSGLEITQIIDLDLTTKKLSNKSKNNDFKL